MSRRWTLLASALLIALSVVFCTLGPSSDPGGPSAAISDGERMAALDEITQAAQDSMLPEGQIDRPALLDYLKADSRFEAAGEAPDGSIWARFRDGRLVMVPPQMPISPYLESELPPADVLDPADPTTVLRSAPTIPPSAEAGTEQGWKPGSLRLRQPSPQANLPASDTAIVLGAFGAGYPKTPSILRSWLSRKGYTVLPITDGSVENLKKVRGVGVFYLDAHGGMVRAGSRQECQARETPVPGSRATPSAQVGFTFGLVTSTPVTEATETAYAKDLQDRMLAYSLGEYDLKGPAIWTYAITGSFVQTYMTFSDDSLVFLNACSSAAGGIDNYFKAANASVLLGWSDVAAYTDRPLYFFDRLLGIDWDHGYEKVDKPKPPNRPFDVDSVLLAMQSHGQTPITFAWKGTTYTTHLEVHRLAGAFSILRPTIETLVVHEDKGELELWGRFGSTQGQVTIGGTEVAILEWKSLKVRVTLPAADKPGASGDVVVKVREHESNPVPLTMWHVEFKYTEGPEQTITAYQWLYLDTFWRADVHRYRLMPDSEVYDQEKVKIEPAEGSSGRWACDWSGTIATLSISTITGEGELPFTREPGVVGFTSEAKLNPEARQITNLQFMLNFDDENTCVTETTGAGYTTQTALGFVLLPSLLAEVSPDYPVTPPLILDEQWVLKGANRDLMGDGLWPWLKWDDIPGKPAPVKDETPG